MSTYLDLFIRDVQGQSNSLPRQDGDTESPDIICAGDAPADDPSTLYGAASYDGNPGKAIAYSQNNYLYVRAKNYGEALGVGTVSLYACYQTQLSTPSLWKQLSTSSGGTTASAGADANGVAVTTEAFVWAPAAPAEGNPYLLVAVVATTAHPDPVAAFRKHPSAFAAWQAQQGGVSALGIAVPPPPAPPTPAYTFSASVNVGNAEPVQMTIGLAWQGAVVGDTISLAADMPGTAGPIGFKDLVISQADESTSANGLIAADYSSVVRFTYMARDAASLPAPVLTLTITTTPASADGGTNHFGPPPVVTATSIASFTLTPTLGS